jgi:hypothetical protein
MRGSTLEPVVQAGARHTLKDVPGIGSVRTT